MQARNSGRGRDVENAGIRSHVRLLNGQSVAGTPMAVSIAAPDDEFHDKDGGTVMRITTTAAIAFAVACSQIAWPVAAQQEASDPTEMEMEGNLPEESLGEKRGGAIGVDPDAVHQRGAASDPAEEAAAADGEVPEDTLLERRQGAIGETPDPVVQGGGGSEGSEEMVEEGMAEEGTAGK